MNNQFESKGRDQNVAQGDRGIGQQNNYGISPEVFAEYAGKLAVTETALTSFFSILEEQQVPPGDLDSKLREIAAIHKELLERLSSVQSEDPEVQRLKEEAGQAIKAGEYGKAEELLKKAEARDLEAIEKMEQTARQRRISAAATNAEQAKLQRVQLRYAKAAEYWQKAAALLPKGEKKDRSLYLSKAGYDLHRISRYREALPLYEQSLRIDQEIGDRAGQGTTLNNIGEIHQVRGDYDKALALYQQSLDIHQEVGNRLVEGATLNNIGQIYKARGEYDKALALYEQSLKISQEIGDKAGEDNSLNNIGMIYQARGDNAKALQYYKQSLAIQQEIGHRYGEAVTSWNIGMIYKKQDDLTKAEQYMARTVKIDEEIGRPELEWEREELEDLRAEIKGQ